MSKNLQKYGLNHGKIIKVATNHNRVGRSEILGVITAKDSLIIGKAVFGFTDWSGYTVPNTDITGPYYWMHTSPIVNINHISDSLTEILTESGSTYLLEYGSFAAYGSDEPSEEVLGYMSEQVKNHNSML